MTFRSRRLAALALAVPLALGLGACGGDDDDDASTEDTGEDTTEDTGTTATTAAEETGPIGASDEQRASTAVSQVFDSSVPFDEKVDLIEGGEAHRADHEAYVSAAEGVGGITVEPTDVAIDPNDVGRATVTYRVLFAGNEAYSDLTMDIARVDGEWQVPTTAFCDFLASARTPCASEG